MTPPAQSRAPQGLYVPVQLKTDPTSTQGLQPEAGQGECSEQWTSARADSSPRGHRAMAGGMLGHNDWRRALLRSSGTDRPTVSILQCPRQGHNRDTGPSVSSAEAEGSSRPGKGWSYESQAGPSQDSGTLGGSPNLRCGYGWVSTTPPGIPFPGTFPAWKPKSTYN